MLLLRAHVSQGLVLVENWVLTTLRTGVTATAELAALTKAFAALVATWMVLLPPPSSTENFHRTSSLSFVLKALVALDALARHVKSTQQQQSATQIVALLHSCTSSCLVPLAAAMTPEELVHSALRQDFPAKVQPNAAAVGGFTGHVQLSSAIDACLESESLPAAALMLAVFTRTTSRLWQTSNPARPQDLAWVVKLISATMTNPRPWQALLSPLRQLRQAIVSQTVSVT